MLPTGSRIESRGPKRKKVMEGDKISIPVPVIDLKDFPSQSNKLLEACKEWGCFRILNHNISPTLLSDMKSVGRSLFELPLDIKRRNTDAVLGSGYMAPSKDNPLYESLGLYDMGSRQAVHLFCNQLVLTPQQRDIIVSYSQVLHELLMDVAQKLAESMGLSIELLKEWTCAFRINKYHFTQESIGSPGVWMHTDSGFLTILQEDECVGGLEVMDKLGSFVPMDPMPGTLLVNLGDIANIWSNGLLHNLKHRVQCKEGATRYSVASFMFGPKDKTVEAPAELVDANHPRLYVPILYEEYRKFRISSGSQAGEALELIRLTATD